MAYCLRDKDSRFYQEVVEPINWYDIVYYYGSMPVSFCYNAVYNEEVIVPAGYCLSKDEDAIRCAVFHQTTNTPDIIYQNCKE